LTLRSVITVPARDAADQTHYERRYEKHDIQHLKELIRLTMFWMNSELLTAKYEAELKKPEKR